MAAPPYDQLVRLLSGTTPPSNLDRRLKPLLHDSSVTADQLLRGANTALHFETEQILELLPWADNGLVVDLRRRMQDSVSHVHDLNRLDEEGNWDVDHKAQTREVIVAAVLLRGECLQLIEEMKRREEEKKKKKAQKAGDSESAVQSSAEGKA